MHGRHSGAPGNSMTYGTEKISIFKKYFAKFLWIFTKFRFPMEISHFYNFNGIFKIYRKYFEFSKYFQKSGLKLRTFLNSPFLQGFRRSPQRIYLKFTRKINGNLTCLKIFINSGWFSIIKMRILIKIKVCLTGKWKSIIFLNGI